MSALHKVVSVSCVVAYMCLRFHNSDAIILVVSTTWSKALEPSRVIYAIFEQMVESIANERFITLADRHTGAVRYIISIRKARQGLNSLFWNTKAAFSRAEGGKRQAANPMVIT